MQRSKLQKKWVVYNNGVVNAIYTAKVATTDAVGTRLNVSVEYLFGVTKAVQGYLVFVDKVIPERLNIQ